MDICLLKNNIISLNEQYFLIKLNGYIFQYEIDDKNNNIIEKNNFKCGVINCFGKYPENNLFLAYQKNIYIYGY